MYRTIHTRKYFVVNFFIIHEVDTSNWNNALERVYYYLTSEKQI